jgi:putative tryptophan/tyrosine transport system substrate-binding protein
MTRTLTAATLVWMAAQLAAGFDTGPAETIAVVYNSEVEAYTQAVIGIMQVLGPAAAIIDIRAHGSTALGRVLGQKQPPVIVAVGAESLQVIAKSPEKSFVIAAMVLRIDAEGLGARNVIALDVPLPAMLERLRAAFPDRRRLGVLWNPAYGDTRKAELLGGARRGGYTLQLEEVSAPRELLRAFVSLRGRADLVLCLPDGALYNSATIKPLILASLEHRLPIAGYSSPFLRAGAAVAVYPDFIEVGRQAAEAARQYLRSGAAPGGASPRKLHVAVNQHVLRLLGMGHPGTTDGKLDR